MGGLCNQLKKRIFITLISVFVLFLFIQQNEQWTSVFRVTEQPDVLMKGNHGMTLTVDLSFGREDVDEWITKLEKPYPLLFLDADWIERSPLIVKKIKEKKIPVGLLGQKSKQYEENLNYWEKKSNVSKQNSVLSHFGIGHMITFFLSH